MKLLPIVGRELRESARRRGTYWLRVRVASQAVVIGIAAYITNLVNPAIKLGTVLFWGLAGVSMLFCLLAGRRSTADCLSLEKREGTLGLLFLTDLKGYDVVLGKLAATSVTGLYALLAVFPVLAVPLLTGGMSGSEGERMMVVLTNTFFFSIAIGIFASAVSRDYRAAMAANFLLWLLLVGAPSAGAIALEITRGSGISPVAPALFYSCPVFSFAMCPDANYTTLARHFWWSIGVTNALAWVLVVLACRIVPRTWGDKPARAPSRQWRWRDVGSMISYGNTEGRVAFRKEALDANAYFWHAARARLKPRHVWMFLGLTGIWWFYCWVKNGRIWLDEITFVATAVFLNSTFKLWITLEAGQRLSEDRRSGAFELLLATPLTVTDILRGQWLALRRQFLKPLLVVVALNCAFIAALQPVHKIDALTVAVVLLVLPFDIAASSCVAMAAALTSKRPTQATIAAVTRILLLPWAIYGLFHATTAALYWLALIPWETNDHFELAEWLFISLAVDLIYGLQAWWALRHDFRRLATQSTQPSEWRMSPRRVIAAIGAVAGRIVPARARIPAAAGVAVVAALWVVHYTRPERVEPARPVVVSITQSNAPLRVFRGGNEGVFLVPPDGSLWRWGATGAPPAARAAMPEQLGTNRDWIKALADGQCCLGLRGNGTIWDLSQSDGTNVMMQQLAVQSSDWVDIGVGQQRWIALKKDGTIWTSQNTTPNSPNGPLTRVGTGSNWAAVCSRSDSYLGLQADGTMWAWGRIIAGWGTNFVNTNLDTPVRLCAETNWTSLDANGRALNRDGELWDTAANPPNPSASAGTVCRRIMNIRAGYRIESAPHWMVCHLWTNGTLWTAPQNGWAAPGLSLTEVRFGDRSDWVALWGYNGTSFGQTADGTVWAWGLDFGHQTVVTTQTRLHALQALFHGQAAGGGGGVWNAGVPPPMFDGPRALMKLVNTPGE